MSEISKVYKRYGESTGKIYLTIFSCYQMAMTSVKRETGNEDVAELSVSVNRYILNEYGNGFLAAYNQFAKENQNNKKLINELEKNKSEFANKGIYDAIRNGSSHKGSNTGARVDSNSQDSEQNNHPKTTIQSTSIDNNDKGVENDGESLNNLRTNDIPMLKSELFCKPYNAKLWKLLGNAYKEKGDSADAKSCYDKAAALDSKPVVKDAISNRSKELPVKRSVGKTETKSVAMPSAEAVSSDESYYFENQEEFFVYIKEMKESGNERNIVWASGDKYLQLFKKGYQQFEMGQYVRAIAIYKEALDCNPVGLAARFELVSAYCKLKQYSNARNILESTVPYLYSNLLIAKYYRQLGYLLVEEKNYKIAAYCYQYSMYYENSPIAIAEMKYIQSQVGSGIMSEIKDRSSVEQTLRWAGIKVIKKSVLDLEDEPTPEKTEEKRPRKGSVLNCKGDIIAKNTFKGQQAITVRIILENTGDEAFPGNVELYYPDLTKVEDFTPVPIAAGSNKTWEGMWIITDEEAREGEFSFFARYPIKNENGNGTTVRAKKLKFRIEE